MEEIGGSAVNQERTGIRRKGDVLTERSVRTVDENGSGVCVYFLIMEKVCVGTIDEIGT